MKKSEMNKFLIPILIVVLGLPALIIFGFVDLSTKIDLGQVVEIIIFAVLVVVTTIYAKRTSEIADATKKQAEEMREQRIIASRPVIIQKAIHRQYISERGLPDYFVIYNAGNGPAIEVEVSLVLQREPPYNAHNCKREGFLRAGDAPIEFHTTFPPEVAKSTFYIVSEYQSIFSRGSHQTWYQTWLPFKLEEASEEGKVYVIAGELEFKDDVTEKERIDAFSSRSKPK